MSNCRWLVAAITESRPALETIRFSRNCQWCLWLSSTLSVSGHRCICACAHYSRHRIKCYVSSHQKSTRLALTRGLIRTNYYSHRICNEKAGQSHTLFVLLLYCQTFFCVRENGPDRWAHCYRCIFGSALSCCPQRNWIVVSVHVYWRCSGHRKRTWALSTTASLLCLVCLILYTLSDHHCLSLSSLNLHFQCYGNFSKYFFIRQHTPDLD